LPLHQAPEIFRIEGMRHRLLEGDTLFEVVLRQALVHRLHSRFPTGRVLACETMIVNSAIRNLIRDQKIEQMQSAIQTGGKTGMQTMNQSLAEHYFKQRITFQEAMAHSLDPEDLRRLMQRQMSAPRT
jgi:twitching motility protein PilT